MNPAARNDTKVMSARPIISAAAVVAVRPGWRTLLHNRTATRQTRRLQREPGVMVGSVPWQVHEGQGS